MNVTRFPNGVSTASTGGVLANLPQPDPTKQHTFFNDFVTVPASNDIAIVGIGGTAATLGVEDDAAGDNGVLNIVTAATAGRGTGVHYEGESFAFTEGKQLFFKTRFSVTRTDANVAVGLQPVGNAAAFLNPNDALVFRKASAESNVFFIVSIGNTDISFELPDALEANVQTEYGFYYDGVNPAISVYQNDQSVGSVSIENNIPDDFYTPSFGVSAGSGNATALNIDYVFASKDR